MNIKQSFLSLCSITMLATLTPNLNAQVTIGSVQTPNTGTLLDLKDSGTYTNGETATKGLGLPCVNLTNLTPTTPTELAASIGATGIWNMAEHMGLTVYNVKERTTETGTCPGIHIWNGTQWQPIIPYPKAATRKIPTGPLTKGTITLLGGVNQAINPSNAKWAELEQNPADYPIGPTTSIVMTDGDNNKYNTQRFYVGYQAMNGIFQTEQNISCNASNPIWTPVGSPQAGTSDVFVDGVWITSNVYSTQKAGGGAFNQGTDNDNKARLNPAYYNNATGAIQIAVGGLSSSTTVKYGENTTSGPWNNTVNQQVYAKKFGLHYTHHQATQLCPANWSLPDDYLWDALANAHAGKPGAIRAKPTANGSYYYRPTDEQEYKWGTHASEGGVDPSGFNSLPSGGVSTNGRNAYNFSVYAYWWSAATSDSYWLLVNYNPTLYLYTGATDNHFSVRCVKN